MTTRTEEQANGLPASGELEGYRGRFPESFIVEIRQSCRVLEWPHQFRARPRPAERPLVRRILHRGFSIFELLRFPVSIG